MEKADIDSCLAESDLLTRHDCPTHGPTVAIVGDIDGKHWCCECLEEWEEDPRSKLCHHCGEPIGDDYYMALDAVWAAADLPEYKCEAHLKCLAARLGRELTPEDFTDAPVNDNLPARLWAVPVPLDSP